MHERLGEPRYNDDDPCRKADFRTSENTRVQVFTIQQGEDRYSGERYHSFEIEVRSVGGIDALLGDATTRYEGVSYKLIH